MERYTGWRRFVMKQERTRTRLGSLLAAVHLKMRGVTEDEVKHALEAPTDHATTASIETQTKRADPEEDDERPPSASTRTA